MAVPDTSTAHPNRGATQSQQATGTSSTPTTSPQTPAMPFPPKDCRACSGAQHMITSFKHLVDSKKTQSSSSSESAPKTAAAVAGAALAAAGAAAVVATSQGAGSPSPPSPSQPPQSPSSQQPPLPCPPESSDLGHASWTFLHTMAAYYPEQPTGPQRSLMRSMMEGLAEFYPCSICAEHLQQQIVESPPDVSSGSALSQWLCRIHNEVNVMLGKPPFDCSRVMERWRDGPADGSCG